MRELLLMAEGRQRHDWQQTAWLLTFIAEPHRDRKQHPEPFTPDQFDPFASRERAAKRKEQVLSMGTNLGPLVAALTGRSPGSRGSRKDHTT